MSGRYLITGAQGLIGRYLTARILEDEPGAEVVGLGRSARHDGTFTHTVSTSAGPRRAPLPEQVRASFDPRRFHYERLPLGDSTRLRALIRDLQPHCIFHLASGLHTAPERELFQSNLEGTRSLVNATADAQGEVARLVLGSSGSVYGEPVSLPIFESHPCRPAALYGMTKLAAEELAYLKAEQAGFTVVCARIFNVVGPGQSEDHVCARLASRLAEVSTSGRRTLEAGALSTTRDFIDVRDVAAALVLVARQDRWGAAWNVASGTETSIETVLKELLRISGLAESIEVARRHDRPRGVGRHVADISRLRALGFSPQYTLSESLSDLYGYYRALKSAPLDLPDAR